jgi:hypothetical protein
MEEFVLKRCEYCNDEFVEIQLITDISDPEYGKPVLKDRKKRFCSLKCLNDWQKKVGWRVIIGDKKADEIIQKRRDRMLKDNPSKKEDVRKKISESVKKYLEDNPRLGDKNPFYGRQHTEEHKKKSSDDKKGKWSYTEEQYQKLLEKTPKGEDHPNWKGGISKLPYSKEFTKELKERIKNRDEHTCVLCNKPIEKICIHHIDYDKKNADEKNLVCLCMSCHSKTNYEREKWTPMFNEIINEKYKQININ